MRCRSRPSSVSVRAAAAGTLLALAACGDSVDRAPRRVVIPTGVSMRAAADSMANAGVVRFPFLFRRYTRWMKQDRAIKAGTYMVAPGATWNEIIDDLVRGRGIVHSVTIPEGLPLSQSLALMARELRVPAESLAAAVRDTALRRHLDVPTPTVEGYLFPDTYTYPDGTRAADIVNDMARAFEKRWTPERSAAAIALGMSRHDVLTMASIVEKEAAREEERAVISAVYHNRLRKNMLLQADPTVQYALGKKPGRVLFRDLRVKSPYNTYRVKGLPPGPIAAPGEASIDAALHPADVPYLYFVARPDGRHIFSTTYREHAVAVRQYREARTAREKRAAQKKAAAKPSGAKPSGAKPGPAPAPAP